MAETGDALRGRRIAVLLAVSCLALVGGPALAGQTRQGDRVSRLLEELSDAPGPSGFEGPVRDIMRELHALGLETSTDGLGSVIGVLAGSSERPRIMLAAHMDEVGAIVRYVTPEGMVKFQLVGGWLDQALLDPAVDHQDQQGPGVGAERAEERPLDDARRAQPRDPS